MKKLYLANQLAWRLVFAVFAVGLVVTVSLTLVLLQFEYNRGLDKVKTDLRTLGSSAAPQLASNLWLVNTDGENHRKLTNFEGNETSPQWSPDGQRIAYVRRAGKEGAEIC